MCVISECLRLVRSGDPESVLSGAADLLRAEGEIEPAIWREVLDALCLVGRSTWYRCRCGEISPESGMVDAICEKCGELRRLPERLSRSPWPLYVAVLRRLVPDCWFDCLASWALAHGLGALEAEKGGAYPSEATDSDAGGASYRQVDARGAVPPQKILRFSNNMQVHSDGDIRGLTWICAEMMDSRALDALGCNR